MSNLIEIQSQIEKLQKQATEIKTREFAITVQDILAKMQAFGITLKDLQSGKGRAAKVRGKAVKVGKSTPAKAKRQKRWQQWLLRNIVDRTAKPGVAAA